MKRPPALISLLIAMAGSGAPALAQHQPHRSPEATEIHGLETSGEIPWALRPDLTLSNGAWYSVCAACAMCP